MVLVVVVIVVVVVLVLVVPCASVGVLARCVNAGAGRRAGVVAAAASAPVTYRGRDAAILCLLPSLLSPSLTPSRLEARDSSWASLHVADRLPLAGVEWLAAGGNYVAFGDQ